MLIIGHRAAAGLAPENTLKAVQVALNLKLAWVEIDVHYVDGQLIVIHDETLERTTNGQGSIYNQSFASLRSLNAGDGEKIPTLDEVFDLADKKIAINIEIKSLSTVQPIVRFIEKYVTIGWDYKNILVSCFNYNLLNQVKQQQSKIHIAALLHEMPTDDLAFVDNMQFEAINFNKEIVNQKLIDQAHKKGLLVYVYTVNSKAELDMLSSLGVDGIFTDFPDKLK